MPLSYVPLDHGCAFMSEAIKEGIVVMLATTLRFLAVEEGWGDWMGKMRRLIRIG